MEDNTKDIGDLEVYELGYHILPTISEEDVQKELLAIHSVISTNDGVIVSEGHPEMVHLAYDIAKKIDTKSLKFNKAYFGWVKFEVDREKVGEIKNKIEAMPSILRYIIVKTVKENTMFSPKAPMFKKENNKEEKEEKENIPDIKVETSEEEIDKSIDELVVNEAL